MGNKYNRTKIWRMEGFGEETKYVADDIPYGPYCVELTGELAYTPKLVNGKIKKSNERAIYDYKCPFLVYNGTERQMECKFNAFMEVKGFTKICGIDSDLPETETELIPEIFEDTYNYQNPYNSNRNEQMKQLIAVEKRNKAAEIKLKDNE